MRTNHRGFTLIELPFDKLRTACESKRRGFTLIELPAMRKREGSAFTLIELLVVIAIIALLVTLFVPALQEAKRQARVVICCTNLRAYAMGLVMYGSGDEKGIYPPHDIAIWGNALTVWSSVGNIYPKAFPDKDRSLAMFRDEICGGDFQILWCPVSTNFFDPGEQYPYWTGGDPEYPGLWYDGRFGQNYMGGYNRFANLANANFTYSRNSETDGPPVRPGGSKDAIIADNVHCYAPYRYEDIHIGFYSTGADTLDLRRENDVAYGDGHVESHSQRGYYENQVPMWDGAGWVLGYGSERLQY